MKIIYCANARIPTEKAHGFQICKMCEQLSKAGCEVELWIPTRKNYIKKSLFDYYNIKNNFQVKVIKTFDFIKFAKILGPLAMHLQRLVFLRSLDNQGIKADDVIFSRDPEVIWWAKHKGARAVYENHDGLGKHKSKILKLIKNTDKIVTTNQFIKHQFIASGFSEEKVLALPHGVDLEIFVLDLTKEQALEKLSLDIKLINKIKHKKILLYTGNFRTFKQDKGITDIIKALQLLNNKDLLFVAVGGNNIDIEFYKNLVKDNYVFDQVVLLGRAGQKKLALWQKVSDILLMPFPDTVHYRENMTPLKMFEYLAAQKPIIASDLPSIRTVLTDEMAWCCKPSNPPDLADKIMNVLNNFSESQVKSENAYNKAKEFSWDNRARKLIDFIK